MTSLRFTELQIIPPVNELLPHPRVQLSIVGSLRDRDVTCSASDRQGSNFESCVWRTVLSHSSHHPQEVVLAQFSLYVHKGSLKPDLFYFCHMTTSPTHPFSTYGCRLSQPPIHNASFIVRNCPLREVLLMLLCVYGCKHAWCPDCIWQTYYINTPPQMRSLFLEK